MAHVVNVGMRDARGRIRTATVKMKAGHPSVKVGTTFPASRKNRRSAFMTEVSAKGARLLASALLTSAVYLETRE